MTGTREIRRRMGGRLRVVLIGLVAIGSASAPLAAQAGRQTPAEGPPRISVGASLGVAFPFHGDFDFTPLAWDADVRVAVSRGTVFEAAVGEWRHSETLVTSNVVVPAAGGGTTTIARLEQDSRRVLRSWQGNLLATRAVGRARWTAGGGVGMLTQVRRLRFRAEGCPPQAGAICGSVETGSTEATFTVQAVGGLDVRLRGSLAAFVQGRFVVVTRDPAGSDVRMTGGLRWSFDW